MSDNLADRNFRAVSQAMHELNDRLSQATAVCAELRQMNATLAQRVGALEQQLMIIRVQNMGRGPTT